MCIWRLWERWWRNFLLCPRLTFLSKCRVAKELFPFCSIMFIEMFSLNHFLWQYDLHWYFGFRRKGKSSWKKNFPHPSFGFLMLSRFTVLYFSSRPLSTNKPQRKLRVTSSTFRTQRSSPTSQQRVNKQRGREEPTASVIQMVDSGVIQWDSKDPVNGFFRGGNRRSNKGVFK